MTKSWLSIQASKYVSSFHGQEKKKEEAEEATFHLAAFLPLTWKGEVSLIKVKKL